MLNQSLGRLQEVCRKLARHALLLNPMPSRLAPQSEVLWLRWKERKAAFSEAVRSASPPSCAGIKRSGTCMQSLRTHVAPFCFGHKNRKVTSGPGIMNDNPERLIPNMSITLQFPGRLEAAASKKVRPAPKWVLPAWSDPRIPFATLLTLYAILGCTILGFNRSPLQILLTIVAGCLLEMLFHRFFCISSKYIFTYQGKHFFNPSLFGIVASLTLGHGLYSSSPAYQWGGGLAMAVFLVTAALALFVFRVGRTALILSFLGFYAIATLIRAYLIRWHMPPEVLILGALTSPRFYLFTFYMITDPKTSMKGRKEQILWALAVVLVDLWLHTRESLSTLFYALFLVSAARLA